jgi:hypothetical protein
MNPFFKNLLDRLGIEANIAAKTLLIAVCFGVSAALLDRIINLPTPALLFSLREFTAVLNGPSYALLKRKDTLAGAIMAVVAGVTTLFVWWLVTKIVGSAKIISPADAYNLPRLLLEGALAGLLSFGWLALLRRLPEHWPGVDR